EGRVLVLIRAQGGRAEASGLGLGGHGGEGAQLFEVRDRTVTRLVTYFSRAGALAELGLEG
ncbi:MAG TPA: hypothetical protein VNY31_03495, partial [Solirubrobacteraceae bacterium]|nr:hypothetical protein [Solirubrobacteraceae bacterium]